MNMLKGIINNKVRKLAVGFAAVGAVTVAQAQATIPNGIEGNVGTVLSGHLSTVYTIAGAAATICIAWTLVKVALRFFRRTG
jgi:hypothetical protein